MKKLTIITAMLFMFILLSSCATAQNDADEAKENFDSSEETEGLQNESPVSRHGQLQFEDTRLVDKNGEIVQLKGMSLFWSQWQPQYYNKTSVKQLKEDWGITVIRAAMAIEHDGYLENPEDEKARVYEVIDAAIEHGIYVIVDWHDHHAEDHIEEAKYFFSELSSRYGQYPNLIYEPYNEPLDVSWSNILKPYHEEIISAIRQNDPDNIIICGTPRWSQMVVAAAEDPLDDINVGYTLHFYAGTHQEELRNAASTAMKKGIPIFVTEFGTTNADGDGDVFYEKTQNWLDFMNQNQLSWCNWSIADKDEASAALKPDTPFNKLNKDENLSDSGKFIKSQLNKN